MLQLKKSAVPMNSDLARAKEIRTTRKPRWWAGTIGCAGSFAREARAATITCLQAAHSSGYCPPAVVGQQVGSPEAFLTGTAPQLQRRSSSSHNKKDSFLLERKKTYDHRTTYIVDSGCVRDIHNCLDTSEKTSGSVRGSLLQPRGIDARRNELPLVQVWLYVYTTKLCRWFDCKVSSCFALLFRRLSQPVRCFVSCPFSSISKNSTLGFLFISFV